MIGKYVLFFAMSCTVFNSCATTSLSHAQSEIGDNADLTQYYAQTVQRLNSQYYIPEIGGNILAYRNNAQMAVSDNTVYLGNLLAWQAFHYASTKDSSYIAKMTSVVTHIMKELAVPTTVPGVPGPNLGYFHRDNVTETSVTVSGTTYPISSDGNSPKTSDNDMSQDQLIHVMFGYFSAFDAIASVPEQREQTLALKALIESHSDQIGVRLKAYNYIITTPSGQPAARGPDVRGFSWPLAQTFATITGQSITRYLDGIDIIDERNIAVRLTNDELKKLFVDALRGLTTGICDLKVGKDHHELCNRFTLRMINILYGTSALYQEVPLYLSRIDVDGDYLGGLWVRRKMHLRIPDSYLTSLQDAVGVNYNCNIQPVLWCADNRWIRMPTSCPESGCNSANPDMYNGVDFLGLYALLLAPKI